MAVAASPTEVVPEAPWKAGVRAMRANIAPGIALWCLGLAVVLAYYYFPPIHGLLDQLTGARERFGLLFPIITTAICGGLLPVLYLRQDPAVRVDYRFKNCIFLVSFWGYKGFEIELWYRLLAHVVGTDHSVRTVAIKCFLDQAIYSPFFAVPLTVLVFAFNHAGLRLAPVIRDLRAGNWYRRHVLPMVIANAVLWVPVVCLVYALPLALQTILFDLALCFCILLIAHITRRSGNQ
jgi:hypothetical protein